MTAHDERRFAALLALMFDVYQAELKPGVEAVYWDALCEYDWEIVRAGIEGLCRDAQHFHRVPRPGDLRIRCGAPTAETLWVQLDQALADGYFAPPPETAPIIRRLIRMLGGWKHITEHMDHDTLQRRITLLAPRLIATEQLGPVRAAGTARQITFGGILKPIVEEADDA
jgi:hypothetical protein